MIQMNWRIDHSFGLSNADLAIVASVDGDKAKITPMKQMIVPPPASSFDLSFESSIKEVIYIFFH